MFARIGIIGTGLIGASVGLGVRAALGDAVEVVGYDSDRVALAKAAERGALTAAAGSAADAAEGADLVVLGVPVDAVGPACTALGAALAPHGVVTDVGSAKTVAVAAGEAAIGRRFIGGHPMAGSERHGAEWATPDLFRGAWWILTPTPATAPEAYDGAVRLTGLLEAVPIALDPATHDALVARLSHVPQIVASALVDVAVAAGERDGLLGLAAGGFRDVTRIAASRPDLWVSILRANQGAVLEALDVLGGRLDDVRALVAGGRWDDLHAWLGAARAARLDLFTKPDLAGEPVTLRMDVPDRPGVLAEVTTQAGGIGVNIEDLRIVHSTEGGHGRLELVVVGEDRATALEAALEALGYRVERGDID